MVFVDEARIFIKAGDGGKGCESFYSDKLTRYPRPDGGDGGKGGSIIFIADTRIQTLLDYRFKQHYQAAHGGHGSSKGKRGKSAPDCVLKVPVGTIISDYQTKLLMKDLTAQGQSIVVAHGGEGGLGNARRKKVIPPGRGEERVIHLELKIIADVGLIGFPNAGKSTIISAISRVRSKVANYPFTTKQPILGIVQEEDFSFIVADLPGLIEGAHRGRGLGDRFLKHAERTKILVHVVDMAGVDGRDPCEDFEKINHELVSYSAELSFKERIVVANKMDLPEAKENLAKFKKRFKGKVIKVSALEKQGLDKLIKNLHDKLCRENFKNP
ncbi:MAG: GTPase ObgE [Candidatus Omnitrophota bacterium]